MKHSVAALIIVAALGVCAEAQAPVPPRDRSGPPPFGTGRIRGRVVAADTGAPLRRALVYLGSSRNNRTISTDADGRFDVANLPDGSYFLTVARNGYASMQFGQRRPFEPGRTLEIANGQLIDRVDFALPRGGVITGRVTDPLGEPVVREMDLRLQSLGFPAPANSPVDAAGRFRIVGFRGRVRMYGGGAGWFVKRVSLKGNDVTTGFDVSGDVDGIEIVLTDRTTTVTGTARDARGIGKNDYIVTFFPVGRLEADDRASRQRTIRPDQDGVYRIRYLPPGDYLAAAVPAMSLPIEGEWDPAFFERVGPRATGFKLLEGQTLSLNLTVIE